LKLNQPNKDSEKIEVRKENHTDLAMLVHKKITNA
jgi:hypothetical protein